MEWLDTFVKFAIGAATAGAPISLYFWQCIKSIRAEAKKADLELEAKAKRDDYELQKIRSSDAYQELHKGFLELKEQAATERAEYRSDMKALKKKVDEVQSREMDCVRKSMLQDAENFKLKTIVEFLEARVKTLEATLLAPPQQQAIVSPAGAAMVAATKAMANEALAETPKAN